MKRLLESDPLTGKKSYFEYDDATGKSTIETTQDVSIILEATKAVRNNPDATKAGIKAGWWHYAHLPDIVLLKMMQEDGVNPYNQNNAKKVGELIEEKYPYCKLTDGKHQIKR